MKIIRMQLDSLEVIVKMESVAFGLALGEYTRKGWQWWANGWPATADLAKTARL